MTRTILVATRVALLLLVALQSWLLFRKSNELQACRDDILRPQNIEYLRQVASDGVQAWTQRP